MATSRTALRLFLPSLTWPPLISRSNSAWAKAAPAKVKPRRILDSGMILLGAYHADTACYISTHESANLPGGRCIRAGTDGRCGAPHTELSRGHAIQARGPAGYAGALSRQGGDRVFIQVHRRSD